MISKKILLTLSIVLSMAMGMTAKDVTTSYLYNANFMTANTSKLYGWKLGGHGEQYVMNYINYDYANDGFYAVSNSSSDSYNYANLNQTTIVKLKANHKYKFTVKGVANAENKMRFHVEVSGKDKILLPLTENTSLSTSSFNNFISDAKNWLNANESNGLLTSEEYTPDTDVNATIGIYVYGVCKGVVSSIKIETEPIETDLDELIEQCEYVLASKDWNSAVGEVRTQLEEAVSKYKAQENYTTEQLEEALTTLEDLYRNYCAHRADIITTEEGKMVTKIADINTGSKDDGWFSDEEENVDWAFPSKTSDNEHWSGDTKRTYINQSSISNNNAKGFHFNIKHNSTPLKAGTYILKFAARRSENIKAVCKTFILEGDESKSDKELLQVKDIATYQEFPVTFRDNDGQNVGYGIATNGDAVYTPDADHEFVYNGKGRGWTWRHMIFTITEDDINKYGVPMQDTKDGDGASATTKGVRVRFVLDAKTGVQNQNISVSDCSLYRINEKEVSKKHEPYGHENTSTGWGTVCLNFSAFIPEGVKLYEVKCLSDDEKAIICEQADVIEAGVGYIFKADKTNGELPQITFEEMGYFTGAHVGFDPKNELRGYLPNAKNPDNYGINIDTWFENDQPPYIMNGGKWHAVKAKEKGSYKLKPHRALLMKKPSKETTTASQTSASRTIAMGIVDGTSGIYDIEAEQKSGVAYNLNGQRVSANAKGIVIINGKKYINK